MTILYLIFALAIAFAFAKIGIAPRRKSPPRQYGVPYANNIYDLARRARRKAAS